MYVRVYMLCRMNFLSLNMSENRGSTGLNRNSPWTFEPKTLLERNKPQVKFFTTYYTLHTPGPHTHKHALLYSTCPAHTSLLSPAHSFSPPVQQIQLHLRIFMPNLMHGFPKPIPCRMHVLCWLPNLQIFILRAIAVGKSYNQWSNILKICCISENWYMYF